VRSKAEPSEWYFFKAGSHAGMKAGPLSWERLCGQAQEGDLEPEDVVWDPGYGWRIAAQVPGLFAEEVLSGAADTGITDGAQDTPHSEPSTGARGRSWLLWLAAVIPVVLVGVALGVYFGLFHDSGSAAAVDRTSTTTTTVAATTSIAVSTTQPIVTSQSTVTTMTDVTTVSASSLLFLGQSDNGREVRLRVGDRVRIELEPNAGTLVRSVRWDFLPIVVEETDSGSEMAGDRVVNCWIELQATVAGPVTIRVQYEYRFGTISTPWVCYLVVTE
jgi:hypothetical protein